MISSRSKFLKKEIENFKQHVLDKNMLTNLLIIGNPSAGKTSYIRKLQEFWESKQYPGEGKKSYAFMVDIDHPILGHVHIYESCEQEVVNDIYDCAIIMCAEHDMPVQDYKQKIRDRCGDIPIMILFNKYELDDVKIWYSMYDRDYPGDLVRFCSVQDRGIGRVEETFQEIVRLVEP